MSASHDLSTHPREHLTTRTAQHPARHAGGTTGSRASTRTATSTSVGTPRGTANVTALPMPPVVPGLPNSLTDLHEPRSLTDARATVGRRTAGRAGWGVVGRVVGVPVALVAADLVAVVVSALWVGRGVYTPWLFGAATLLALAAFRQYRPRLNLASIDELPRTVGGVGVGTAVALAVAFLTGNNVPSTEPLARAGVVLLVAVVARVLVFAVARRARRAKGGGRRTLVVGAGRMGRTVTTALHDHPELGLTPVGFADPDPTTGLTLDRDPLLVTDMSRLAETIVAQRIDTAVLAFGGAGDAHVDTVITVHQTGCDIFVVPEMFELHHDGPDVERVRGVPLLRLRPDPTQRVSWWVKRGVDVAAGALALALLAVPLAVIALAVLIDSGRPVLFWQERVGLDGRTFRLAKFRSMTPRDETDSQTTWNIASDPRVSRIGKVLRRTSLDELPQLWNIVRGQMSLVGPRPERPSFVAKFSEEHERYWARHRVPVGLTGLAQVSGLRGDTSIRERARYDNYYIANWSLWLDLKIMVLTVREVLGGGGR